MLTETNGRAARIAAIVLGLGAVAAVLAAAPYKAFDLDRYFVPKELVLYIAATIAGVAAFIGGRRTRPTVIDFALGGFLALSVVAAIFATNRWLALRAVGISFGGVIVYWTARALARSGSARPIVIGVATAATVAALLSLLQAYGVDSEYFSLNRAPGGTLGNRNFVAHIVAIGLPSLVLCAVEAESAVGGVLAVVAMAITCGALFMSRSRGAWLAVLVSGGVAVLVAFLGLSRWSDARRLRRLAVLGVAALVGVAVAWIAPNRLNWNSNSPYLDSVKGIVNTSEGSGHGRILQYKNSLQLARQHPVLGVGPGNWPVAYPRVVTRSDPSLDRESGMTSNPWPSSDWVAAISERGVLATLLLAIAVIGIAFGAFGAMWRAREADAFLVGVALVATVLATVIVGAFDAVLLLALPTLVAWAALGALSPAPTTGDRPLSDSARGRWILAIGIVGIAFALRSAAQLEAMAIVSHGDSPAALERASHFDPGSYRIRMKLADAELARRQCDGVRRDAGAAQKLFPNAPAPRRLLAQCGTRTGR